MPAKLPPHVAELFAFLTQPQSHEAAHQHRAHAYFQHLFGLNFKVDERHSDGYVAGHFVLELKGASSDWHAGLIQGLAYHKQLDFAVIVVAAREFLAMWRVDALPLELRDEVMNEPGSPHKVGLEIAKRYKKKKDKVREHLALAMWRCPDEVLSPLLTDPNSLLLAMKQFESILRAQQLVRERVTPQNFTSVLRGLVPFFDEPLKAVRAFYSMIFAWDAGSRVLLSEREPTIATLHGENNSGERIEHLVPARRDDFKEYVERFKVQLRSDESLDDFFAHYDDAIDTVDAKFRSQNGIFFTDLALAKFVMWNARRELGDIGKHHLVIDPACGSGNLVTNWRSPMELRHKVVSDIEKELLFAVERRMRADAWHDGRFTVVPKVTADSGGLNFLDIDAKTYLKTIRKYLKEKGLDANRPIAFLCNPPFRSDDDKLRADKAPYEIDKSIVDAIGTDAAQERYCCFLAQMKLVCDAAEDAGLPGDSLMLVFSRVGWLTDRDVLSRVRHRLMGNFDFVAGLIVNSREFFKGTAKFPVSFTMWRYRPHGGADTSKPAKLIDLTWLKNDDLARIHWHDAGQADDACTKIVTDSRAELVSYGIPRANVREWTGLTRFNFYRTRRVAERNVKQHVGGLPTGDSRVSGKQVYGETTGAIVGFMADLTPCRIARLSQGVVGVPWFRLDSGFMDTRKARCFSGPPDTRGYCANPATPEATNRVFFWYALHRTFLQHPFPLWVDPLEMWAPAIPEDLQLLMQRLTRAIAFAENECIETRFPGNNPVPGAVEVLVRNPMSPTAEDSYWTKYAAHLFDGDHSIAGQLVAAVGDLYARWRALFRTQIERPFEIARAYYVGGTGVLNASSGMIQIKDYFERKDDAVLRQSYARVQELLRAAKTEFYRLLTAKDGLDYFGDQRAIISHPPPPLPPPIPPPVLDSQPAVRQHARAAAVAKRKTGAR